jgi:hypothetical protein
MTELSNHQKVRLLKMIRQVIDTGIDGMQRTNICTAITVVQVVEESKLSLDDRAFLIFLQHNYVPTQLQGFNTLDKWTWLECQPQICDPYRMQEANDIGGMMRLAWIDRMIFELETKMVLP